MMEENIEPSPTSLNSSMQEKREHRMMKRKRVNNEKIIQTLFDDEIDESSVTLLQVASTFNRFEAETKLATADRLDVFCKPRRRILAPSQDFCTCEKLMEDSQQNTTPTPSVRLNDSADEIFLSCQNENLAENFDIQSEWILEDHERGKEPIEMKPIPMENKLETCSIDLDRTLIPDACDITLRRMEEVSWDHHSIEEAFDDWSPKEPLEPKESKSIIDLILEDFCSSPTNSSDPSEPSPNPDDMEPFFRFRKKKIRTYERCWRQAAQFRLRNVVETARIADDDALSMVSDASSELSVQEDKSQVIIKVETSEHLNTSSRIRNNLLDLSVFFTQNVVDLGEIEEDEGPTICQPVEGEEEEEKPNDITEISETAGSEGLCDLIMELISLRTKYPISYGLGEWNWNENEPFSGFLFEAEKPENMLDNAAAEPRDRNLVCRSAPTVMLETNISNDIAISPSKKCRNIDCPKSPQIVFDEESWQHDGDFFANFQTQVVLHTSSSEKSNALRKSDSIRLNDNTTQLNTEAESECDGIQTKKLHNSYSNNLNKKIEFKNGVGPSKTLHNNFSIIPEDNAIESQIPVEDILRQFDDNQHKSDKKESMLEASLETSKELEMNFDCMLLADWPLDEFTVKTKNEIDKNARVEEEEPSCSKRNHREEEIKNSISSNSKRKLMKSATGGLHHISNFPPINDKNNKEVSKCFTGFLTASRKPISVSEEAQKKAKEVFAQLPDLPEDSFHNANEPENIENKSSLERINNNNENELAKCFTGFHTASRKPINVSEEAQKKAKEVFAQLPDFPEDAFLNPNEPEDIGHEEAHTKKAAAIFAQLPDVPSESEGGKSIQNAKESENMPSKNDNQNERSPVFRGFECEPPAQEKSVDIIAHHPELSDKRTENQKNANSLCFTGFHTALRKPINVSEEAQKKAAAIFAELPDLPCETEDIKTSATKMAVESNRNKATTNSECYSETPKSMREQGGKLEAVVHGSEVIYDNIEDFVNIPLSEWIPTSQGNENQDYEAKTEEELSMKRRLDSVENVCNNQQRAKLICRSRTTIGNSTNPTQISDTQNTQNSKIIGRKNLLSLSKRKRASLSGTTKSNIKNEAGFGSMDFVETPVKSLTEMKCVRKSGVANPQTPLACAFFAQLPTAASTPEQTNSIRESVTATTTKSVDNLESDFKRINWENTDECQTNNAATPSSKLNKPSKAQLSPLERIENLSSCGDPPPLVQLIGASRIRNMGLSRRWRDSVFKK